MICKVVVILLMFFFVQINHAMDRLDLKLIPTDQLSEYIGKNVVYHKGNDIYESVILGERVLESAYYQARLARKPGHGIICLHNRLYLSLSGRDNTEKAITGQ